MSTTRATLLARLNAKDKKIRDAAGVEFGNTYRTLIEQYASRLAKGADVDEITTAVIYRFVLRPIQYVPDPDKPGRFRRLLMGAVKWRWLDLHKKRKQNKTLSSDWLDDVAEEIPEITEEGLLLAAIWAAFNAIRRDFSPTTVYIFVQFHFQNVPAVEIACALEMTEEAVRQATSRVRTRLSEELVRRGINSDGFA